MIDPNPSFVIDLTDEQRELLGPHIQSIRPGETLFAQVYGDGIRVKKMTSEQSNAIRAALEHIPLLDHYTNSAYEAQAMAGKWALQ